jgi:amino acid adenylation domain-containing protein
VDAIVGLLGILKAGGAYVPLSLEAPAARLAHQLRECGASVVVTGQAHAESLPANVTAIALDRGEDAAQLATLPVANPAPLATPTSLAYVLYTSGSTGTPKGVAVTHANAVHYARAVSRVMADIPAAEAGDGFTVLDGFRFAMASTLAADLGNTSLLPSLLSGATLHLLSKEVTTDPVRYQEYLTTNRIDVLKITPSHLAALTAGRTGSELGSVLPGRWLVLGGEALRPDLARALLDAGSCRVLNHYGPTETTVGACTLPVTSASLGQALALGAQTVPIGRPLANMHAYVVDAHDNEQPVGAPGELLLGGRGVAQGYFGRPDLTAERFTTFRGERVYRTGDRVRRLSDGTIEFLGRADDQVKVRGYRVELGEIEQVLAGHPAVAHAVVALPVQDGEEPQLVAYVVLRPGGSGGAAAEPPGGDSLREWLGTQLPGYMVPATFVLLDRIPLTPNGKVDRAKLPAPGTGSGEARRSHIPPRTETETKLAAIWEEVLKKEKVGISDNFLLLGGHSLLAIRMLGKISRALGVRLPLRTLFDAPTIEQLALAVEAERTVAAPAPTIGARTRDAYRMGTTAPDEQQGAP